MCDACSDFIQLLISYESQVVSGNNRETNDELPQLTRPEVDVVYAYIQTWPSRQCMCCYRDPKNLERFSHITHGLIHMVVAELKQLSTGHSNKTSDGPAEPTGNNNATTENNNQEGSADSEKTTEGHHRDKLLVLVAKIFLLNFPLYVAYKHTISNQAKLDEFTQQEVQNLNLFCDLHDSEIPICLLKNVSWFCKLGGLMAMTACFTKLTTEQLPVSSAHAMITIVGNLKLWMNYKSIVSMLVPLRSCVLRYMCKLSDQELRAPTIKSMADFMWNAIKDPLDTPLAFDVDGLDLAFKYFTSSTLTMRLAGISQINHQIGVLAEICVGDSLPEAESAPRHMADWLIQNNIISHVFGPNLHVELIKQSHIILNFLAMENRVSCEHVDAIWSAAQLKHCSKPVHDLLPGLVKHLTAAPTLHLYGLLTKLEPRDHTEQTLYLASALIKSIWSRGGGGVGNPGGVSGGGVPDVGLISVAAAAAAAASGGALHHKCLIPATSSENSVSMDPSNSEEDHGESTGQSESHKSDSEDIDGVEIEDAEPQHHHHHHVVAGGPIGPPPCKLARKQNKVEEALVSRARARANRRLDDIANPELDGVPIKTASDDDAKVAVAKKICAKAKLGVKLSKHQTMKLKIDTNRLRHRRKNILLAINPLPEGIETIGSSSSDEEEEVEEEEEEGEEEEEEDDDDDDDDDVDVVDSAPSNNKFRKRRKVLRKNLLVKRQKSVPGAGLKPRDGELGACQVEMIDGGEPLVLPPQVSSLVEAQLKLKPEYLDESSSCSELGPKDSDIMEDGHHHHHHDATNFLALSRQGGHILEMLSGDEGEVEGDGSYSSRMSNKSEKNMADFDGEDSVCEEELAQLNEHAQINLLQSSPSIIKSSPLRGIDPRLSACFKVDNVCQPGNTLLWDLLQDDKICNLGEGLAIEAEKTLCNLICYTPDKEIRMKFIEGCLNNLANNASVVVSLRMLPKLLTSFRGIDMHHVTNWAEHQHHMMRHFFNNLKTYTANPQDSLPLYTHQMQVQVRLHFLSAVFSPVVSPTRFKLSIEQVDTLWECLAHDPECCDELSSWLLSQAKTTEMHALKIDAMRRLYMRHLPSLPPENFSMICLGLFQQLCSLNHVLVVKSDGKNKGVKEEGSCVGMDHMWKIALRALNTDVSMSAIQYINGYYMGHNLQNEGQFVSQCMTHLRAASDDLSAKDNSDSSNEDGPLLCIQRGLLLLKSHLETFKRRYAYHLRRWALEGRGVGSHSSASIERCGGVPIRVIVQSGGTTERCFIDLMTSDYVADLRAEIVKWAEDKDSLYSQQTKGDTCVRIITQGQELTFDSDEKSLAEMGFKDNQMVYSSIGVSRNMKKRECMELPSMQPPPPRESVPTLLLLKANYFEQLFSLMHTLSAMKVVIKGGRQIPHTKAQVLSRRVWDILSLLPTSPTLLQGFKQLDTPLTELLDPSSPQKLMYSLYIVESLSNTPPSVNKSSDKQQNDPWSQTFIQHGGLRHLFDIFMSGVLQCDGNSGSEWQQDCLALLLKIIFQLGVESLSSTDAIRPSRNHNNNNNNDKIFIPTLNKVMLGMIDVKSTMAQLTSILNEASLPKDPNHYKTGFWGRAQVVHYAMALLVSWLRSSEEARQALFHSENFSTWLQRLVLEDPEPAVRRETCSAIYRLCFAVAIGGGDQTPESGLVAPMLSELLQYLPKAESMRPTSRMEAMHAPEEGKEPYGPACRDYFWLVTRLIDSLPEDLVKESLEDPQNCVIDINSLASKIAQSLLQREYLETRHRTIEDDGLIGLINLLTNLMKHRPPFQVSKQGQELLVEVFDFLFALPSPKLRHVPKCKSARSRAMAYDLLVELVKGAPRNYYILHEKLLQQHQPGPHSPYPWDYWPHEDGRSDCGYVGLTNLGATCYMASCMQHLYMMPQARASILGADTEHSKHEPTLKELQRMFAYLLESERKAYNPRSFCKVYTMDHQPLNTAEQKDMAEFFIDLVSKLEEMTPGLKSVIKKLFCGVISNNVVSLDCGHVSRTLEEFYTVRCQVADMRNLYESLDEVTVKDTLEGDNMYTCSQCGKKVRAEKRACFKTLPHILCFNTMRYTFNMLTMLKEKVNTHFSFPLRLNMAGYVEKQLMPQHYQEDKHKSELMPLDDHNASGSSSSSSSSSEEQQYEYDLIGVTVHTGTADGGHYYSFIKDRTPGCRDKWFLFNDAEVKPFDPNQIAAECFGGEMTSKTYDSVTDKFMDFSFEKTNSAYMLFYERCPVIASPSSGGEARSGGGMADSFEGESCSNNNSSLSPTITAALAAGIGGGGGGGGAVFELSKELEDWIWQDNMHFIQDKNIFEHTYFNFMWQICGYIPQTILPIEPDITQKAAQLSTSFFIETFIHAKEKPTMVQWVELVTKQFNACQEACVWFLEHMASDTWWPVQVLLKCPNQMVRQMFQRLCIHVIQRLKQSHSSLYLVVTETTEVVAASGDQSTADASCSSNNNSSSNSSSQIGNASCVTKFVKTLLSLMEHGAKAHLKHLTEYFGFLYEFSKMGEEEHKFLLAVGAISTMVHFYLGQRANDFVDVSEGEDEEEVVASLPNNDKYKPASLDKMITLVASLVEKSRDSSMKLQLNEKDYSAVAEGKGFPFLYQQIKDNINLQQTRNLIHSLCRGNNQLAQSIIGMISQAISRHSDTCQPFFKILTLLTESTAQGTGGSSSQPCFTQLVLQKVWEAAECCPYSALDWLALQVTRNRLVHQWVLSSMDSWLEHFLIAHSNQRVRNAAGYLLVSLVPSTPFRQGFRATHRMQREPQLTDEAQAVLHQVYTGLLRLLSSAKHYTDMQQHGTMKLTTYFALLMYCCISRTEKLKFGQYFIQLWHLFHPKLSEPSIPAYHNKQALLAFWNHVCTHCSENVQLMLQNAHVTKNIAFNYILADHDDQEIVMYNRAMLPAYYGLLRMMCQHSRVFTRHLAQHQNLQWAFKNITPHPTQYPQAVEELFKLMQLMVMKHPDMTEAEQREICSFRRNTLMTYLGCLDGRTSWGTLISAFRVLLESNDDKLYVVYNGGLQIVFECFQNLHIMLHEATACHVSGDLADILTIIQDLVRCLRMFRDNKDTRSILLTAKDWLEVLRKLATLLNTYNPPEIRLLCIDVLKEFVLVMTPEVMQILVPLLSHCHSAFQDSHDAVPLGPYFPRRGQTTPPTPGKGGARPLRPMVQMTVPHAQLECARGVDPDYDAALDRFYAPYHDFIDMLFRLAVNGDAVNEVMVSLSAVVGFEAVPLHSTYFPKLWLDILKAQNIDRKYIQMLTTCNYFVDYVDAVLLDERAALNVPIIYDFLVAFFPKVSAQVLSEQTLTMIDNTVVALSEQVESSNLDMESESSVRSLCGDLRALILVYGSPEAVAPPLLRSTLKQLGMKIQGEIAKLQSGGDTISEVECNKPSTSKDECASTSKKSDASPSTAEEDNNEEGGGASKDCKKVKKCVASPALDNLLRLESIIKELFTVIEKHS